MILTFVWTLGDVVVLSLLALCGILILGAIIVEWFKSTFMKNCYYCKYCYLKDVAGCGDGARYGCRLGGKSVPDRMITHVESTRMYTWCKKYEDK